MYQRIRDKLKEIGYAGLLHDDGGGRLMPDLEGVKPPDVILVDGDNGEPDAIQLIASVKQQSASVLVLAMVGSFQQAIIDRILKAGAHGLISKDAEPVE